MERQSISLIGFSVFFGILLGLVAILGVLFSNGFFSSEPQQTEKFPTGMEMLQNHSCNPAETKQILIGGIEDNYDPAGHEPTTPNDTIKRHWQTLKPGGKLSKPYDDKTSNRFVADTFDIPAHTFHGLIVVRMQELSRVKNDSFGLGYSNKAFPMVDYQNGYGSSISNLPSAPEWQNIDDLYFARFESLNTSFESAPENLLNIVRTKRDQGLFNLVVADDTVVDFVGFALCLEPSENKGTAYVPRELTKATFDSGPASEIVLMMAATVDGQVCGYGGCVSCAEKRPMSCIEKRGLPEPAGLNVYAKQFWSGGEIKFTKPVAGSLFATEDDANEYCAATFGDNWRVLSRHDGNSGGATMAFGTFPATAPNAWITMKDQPHDNCWRLRPDYDALQETGNDR